MDPTTWELNSLSQKSCGHYLRMKYHVCQSLRRWMVLYLMLLGSDKSIPLKGVCRIFFFTILVRSKSISLKNNLPSVLNFLNWLYGIPYWIFWIEYMISHIVEIDAFTKIKFLFSFLQVSLCTNPVWLIKTRLQLQNPLHHTRPYSGFYGLPYTLHWFAYYVISEIPIFKWVAWLWLEILSMEMLICGSCSPILIL